MSEQAADIFAAAEKPPQPDRPVTASAMKAALRVRFDPNEFAMFYEVGELRRADVVALNKWHSRAYAVHGVEIKVSRSDWLRELKQPSKAEEVMAYCDHWWLACPPKIANLEEVPPNWGLLELRGDTLVAVRKAPKLESKPFTKRFAVMLLRKEAQADEAAIDARVRREVEKVREASRAQVDRLVEQRTASGIDWKEKYEAVIGAFGGVQPYTLTDDITAAIRLVLASGVVKTHGHIVGAMNSLSAAQRHISDALANFKPDNPAALRGEVPGKGRAP